MKSINKCDLDNKSVENNVENCHYEINNFFSLHYFLEMYSSNILISLNNNFAIVLTKGFFYWFSRSKTLFYQNIQSLH